MKQRYYLSMLSLFLLVLVFDAVYIPAHKSLGLFLFTGGVHFVLFGLVNLLGIRYLYKPVEQAFEQGKDTPQARVRIRQLSWYSTAWIFLLGVLYFGTIVALLLLMPVDTGEVSMAKMPAVMWLTAIPSTLYIYAVLPAFITYFLINDFTLDLKTEAFNRFNILYPVGKKHIGLTLLVAFIILGFFPSVLVSLELIVSGMGNEYAQFSGMNPLEAILPDRAIVLIGMVCAVVFITRSFTKPIYALLQEINTVRDGDYSARAAVVTEDEIGTLTQAFNEMVQGLEERERIRDTFGKYVTKDVADVILSQKINLAGEVRTCTILATDIANYTTISEDLAPQEIIAMLNEYFSEIVTIIQQHKGVVNKFIGDAVFALFNVPLNDPDHARHAIQAALAIQEITATRRFGKDRRLSTRIGINTGAVVAGNIGSAERLEYTVVGDDVNVAARLEQLNKEHGTSILVGENTFALTKEQFAFVELGVFQLKGKERPVRVYQVTR